MYIYIVNVIDKGDSLFYMVEKKSGPQLVLVTTAVVSGVVSCNINSTAVQPST